MPYTRGRCRVESSTPRKRAAVDYSTDAVMRRTVTEALALIPAAEGAAIEIPAGANLIYVHASGSLALAIGTEVKLDASLSGLALQTSSTLYCADVFNDPRADLEASVAAGVRSMICVPLRNGNSAVAVLKVASSLPDAFTGDDVSILTGVAEFLSSTLTLARALTDTKTPSPDQETGPQRSRDLARFMANVSQPGLADDIDTERRIRSLIAERDFSMVFQPVVSLRTGELVGAEALARFHPGPYRSPDVWFSEAAGVGLGVELELAVAARALRLLPKLPPHIRLGVNFGPEAVADPRLAELISTSDPQRITLELTEHDCVANYDKLRSIIMELRETGVQLALDDVGTGFSNLAHIVNFAPDVIKLDMELVRGIDVDPVRRSLARAMASLANETGAEVVGEGIEREEERRVLLDLDIGLGQGYLLGKPGPAAALGLRPAPAPATNGRRIRSEHGTGDPSV